jgi:hypothetical protein
MMMVPMVATIVGKGTPWKNPARGLDAPWTDSFTTKGADDTNWPAAPGVEPVEVFGPAFGFED